MDNAFDASSGSVNAHKSVVKRLCVWLQPIRAEAKITKTERVCFNAHANHKIQGIGTPAVFFPLASKSVWNEFSRPAFAGLKNRVYTKRCFPVSLLEMLSGN
jgi:hypothetical protein